MIKILIMGLPGSGKSTLASDLKRSLEKKSSVEWLNADDVRKKYDDWDFSEQGRIRQSIRMRDLCTQSSSKFVICDFVAPLEKMRVLFNPDYMIWMNTITQGRYADTNAIFEPPKKPDLTVNNWDSTSSVNSIIQDLVNRNWLSQ